MSEPKRVPPVGDCASGEGVPMTADGTNHDDAYEIVSYTPVEGVPLRDASGKVIGTASIREDGSGTLTVTDKAAAEAVRKLLNAGHGTGKPA